MDHIYKNIDGYFRETDKAVYDRMVQWYKDGDIFVEIGSFKGKSASIMAVNIANSNKDIKFYCVDSWDGMPEHQKGAIHEDQDTVSGKLFQIFLENTKSISNYITPIRKSSLEAANDFEDKSLAFVYIDALHDYENVKKDIEAWYPKVKFGGTLAGHDWNFIDVAKAVVEFAEEKKLKVYNNTSWEILIR